MAKKVTDHDILMAVEGDAALSKQELDAFLSGVTPASDAEIQQLLIQSAAEAAAPRVRQNVARAVNPAAGQANPAAPEAPRIDGMKVFEALVQNDGELQNMCISLSMVSLLLRESFRHRKPDESLLHALNFDSENLQKLMLAVTSSLNGQVLPELTVITFLKRGKWLPQQIIYQDILGLREHAAPQEVVVKMEQFRQLMNRLKDLLSFLQTESVNALFLARSKKENAGKSNADLVKEAKLDTSESVKFDVEAIEEMLEEVRSRPAGPAQSAGQQAAAGAPAPAPKKGIDLAEFAQKPVGVFLGRLQKALAAYANDPDDYEAHYKNQYFYGEEALDAIQWINGILSEVKGYPDFGNDLILTDPNELLEMIAKHLKTNDPQILQAELDEIYGILGQRFYKLKPASGMNYEAIKQEIKSDPKMKNAHIPLYHLFYALRRSEAEYEAKDKDALFGGLEQGQVMGIIDQILGAGTAHAFQHAARQGTDADRMTCLIREMAERFDLTAKPDELKAKLLAFREALASMYGPYLGNIFTL